MKIEYFGRRRNGFCHLKEVKGITRCRTLSMKNYGGLEKFDRLCWFDKFYVCIGLKGGSEKNERPGA